ncbi:MAG: hypothetical protein GY805_08410, partial [Chloroflexi bacterium]|nr:hypothetical protein [Chloroflexota bacterium]
MFDQSMEWLKKHWWGLIIAHFLILAIVYTFIWQLAEPLGIYDNLSNLTEIINTRVFLHITLTLIFGAYFTLILDLFLRWQGGTETMLPKNSNDTVKAKILFATDVSDNRV